MERGDSHGFSLPSLTRSVRCQVFVGPAGAKEASPISGACYAATRAGRGATLLPMQSKGFKRVQKGQNMSFSSIPANLESMVKRIS